MVWRDGVVRLAIGSWLNSRIKPRDLKVQKYVEVCQMSELYVSELSMVLNAVSEVQVVDARVQL